MRGVVFGFLFTACIVVFAALALLSFNGCGEVDGDAVMTEIYAERLACERSAPESRTCH